MKIEKFKVLLYLKKSGLEKSGKAPITGRITVNRTMAQFSSKLSCTPELWNPRESRLNGKSKEAVEINAKIDKLLLAINSAFDSILERKIDFDATAVKESFQGSVEAQMTLLRRLDIHIEDMQSRIGVDVAKSSMSTYIYTRRYLGEFIKKRFKVEDLAFGQLNEHLAYEFQEYVLKDKGLSIKACSGEDTKTSTPSICTVLVCGTSIILVLNGLKFLSKESLVIHLGILEL